MKHFFLLIISIIFLLNSHPLFSQNEVTDSQLALQYFQDKEFEKAAVLYEKLFQQTRATTYFNYYLKCLTELKKYEEAEKEIKKQERRNPYELSYYVELGYLYKLQEKNDKSVEEYEKAIRKLTPDQNQIISLANAFLVKREAEYAEKVYLQGRKILKGDYSFRFELASVYQYQRNYQKMIDEYLDLLGEDEGFIQTVQNQLQNAVYNDVEHNLTDLLKVTLLKRVQEYPQASIYCELLIWLYIQELNFDDAFSHTISLDKRNREKGERLLNFANIAILHEDFDVAVRAYKYVLEKGKNNEYYFQAKNGYLNSLYQKIISQPEFVKDEILALENTYLETISELGLTLNTFKLNIDLSHIQAFYLQKTEEALSRMQNTLLIPGLSVIQIAQCKLELADIYLLDDNPWEATLLYAQVEKSLTDNPLNHEAKFRKAKLAYFTGDFEWARAQLDVLKASTSKLIANDAMYLSSLINDNLSFDSTGKALQMYARGELLVFQHKDSLALLTFDSISTKYSANSLADEVYFKKAEIMIKRKKFIQAKEYLQHIVDHYSYDILGDDAMFKLADLYQNHLTDNQKAQEFYKELMTRYPGSIYVVEARKRFRKLRGDLIE